MRFAIASSLSLALILLSGCAGYHLGPVNGAVAGEKSIEIFPFNNQTLEPRLGDAVTQAMRERIQTDGTYHLATHGGSDVVLTGTLKRYYREGLSFLNTDVTTTENYRVGLVAHVVARESGSGKVLLEKDISGFTLINVGTDLASADRQALSLLADDLARNITVALTEGGW
jgi:hypothetical protein